MLAQTRGYPQVGEAFVTDTGLRLTLRRPHRRTATG